jgi:hypothetical protein
LRLEILASHFELELPLAFSKTMSGTKQNPLTFTDDPTQDTTFLMQKFLVYPFVQGEKVELAAKDLPLCDFVGDYDVDAIISHQMEHLHGLKRSHILTFCEHDCQTLNPRAWVNDTVMDFWFRWIV